MGGATMITGKARKLTNQELMTAKMETVLIALRDAANTGTPFIHLTDAHQHTLRALVRRDWIFPSAGKDGTRYKITGRGLKALKAYEQPPYRQDGICPTCGVRPRKVYPGGRHYGYCHECELESKRRMWKMKGKQIDRNAPCSDCGIRPRHVYPSGAVIIYCYECRNERRKEERRLKHARLLQRIRDGEVILCIRCHAAPRYHNSKHVYDYCYDCYRAYMRDYNDRRRPNSKVAKQRRKGRGTHS